MAYRTPGFTGWQQEQWWANCHDAAEFLGVMGYAELQQHGDDAVAIREAFQQDTQIPDSELDKHLKGFHREHSPTAYLFRCRHCRKLGGYWDAS